MEPPRTKVELGHFRVTEVEAGRIRVALGQGVNIWIHLGTFPHATQAGDMIPLFTELKYALTISTPVE